MLHVISDVIGCVCYILTYLTDHRIVAFEICGNSRIWHCRLNGFFNWSCFRCWATPVKTESFLFFLLALTNDGNAADPELYSNRCKDRSWCHHICEIWRIGRLLKDCYSWCILLNRSSDSRDYFTFVYLRYWYLFLWICASCKTRDIKFLYG